MLIRMVKFCRSTKLVEIWAWSGAPVRRPRRELSDNGVDLGLALSLHAFRVERNRPGSFRRHSAILNPSVDPECRFT
jgi:hypothetical protein